MDKIYLIFGLIIVLIIYYLYQQSENFGFQDPNLLKCLNDCNNPSIRMAGGYESTGACQRKC